MTSSTSKLTDFIFYLRLPVILRMRPAFDFSTALDIQIMSVTDDAGSFNALLFSLWDDVL
jgi:hypothetical protein